MYDQFNVFPVGPLPYSLGREADQGRVLLSLTIAIPVEH